MRHSLRRIAVALAFTFASGLASEARAEFTYNFADYPADQGGASVTGYITLKFFSDAINVDQQVLDWSMTVSSPTGGSFTTKMTDLRAQLTIVGIVRATATEITMASGPGGIMMFSGDSLELIYENDSTPSYSGFAGGSIEWETKSPSMGGTDPWLIARVGGVSIPEPPSLVLLGSAILGLAGCRAWRG